MMSVCVPPIDCALSEAIDFPLKGEANWFVFILKICKSLLFSGSILCLWSVFESSFLESILIAEPSFLFVVS